jgi:heme/copper-type cytochrome/quinol oxidase subunit 3
MNSITLFMKVTVQLIVHSYQFFTLVGTHGIHVTSGLVDVSMMYDQKNGLTYRIHVVLLA